LINRGVCGFFDFVEKPQTPPESTGTQARAFIRLRKQCSPQVTPVEEHSPTGEWVYGYSRRTLGL
jgi:hypothetical protein